jgi:hypothetical protein
VLSNRHHYRDSGKICERFGCQVHVPSSGLHRFTDGEPVVGYQDADELQGEFEHLLLAHGLPLIGNGRRELEQLVSQGGRTAGDAF